MNAKTTKAKKQLNDKHGKTPLTEAMDAQEAQWKAERDESRAIRSMFMGAAPHFIAAGIDTIDAQARAYDAEAMKNYAAALATLGTLGGVPALDPVKTAIVGELGALARRLNAKRTASPTATTDVGEVKQS